MGADAVGGDFTVVHQSFVLETVHPEQAAARVGGVIFRGVQPLTAFVNDRMAIEVPVRLRGQGLQQRTVAQVDQVALGTRSPGNEQRNRQLGVIDDVVAALADLGGEHARAVQSIADGVVLAVAVVAGRKQQRTGVLLLEQLPAAQRHGTQQQTAESQSLASQHGANPHQSPSLALKPS
ncbi:hypothetical protein D3C85_736780 [compost metagenome]